MKKSALIMMICVAGVALSAEEYTIQTISALKESSITPAFEKKVQKSALASDRKKEGACNIVTVGHYSDEKTARASLKTAKTIAKDAFIRPISREIPKICDSMTLEGKSAASGKSESNVTAATVKPVAVAVKGSSKASVVASVSAAVAVKPSVASNKSADTQQKTPENSSTASSAPQESVAEVKGGCSPFDTVQTAVLIYDRNLARKRDIHEAIEYYKNSPYHSFRPVAMQSSSPKGL